MAEGLYYLSWILITSLGSRQSTYKSRQPFTRALQILIRIVTRVQPTSRGGFGNPDANFYLTLPLLALVSGQSWRWQPAHARVGGAVWWTSTSFSLFGRLQLLSVYRVVGFVPAGKILVHRELEVHTVYQRFLTSWQRPTPKDISGYLHAYTRCVATDYKLELKFLNKSWVHKTVQFSL